MTVPPTADIAFPRRDASRTCLRRSSRRGDASMRETSFVKRTFPRIINAQGACERSATTEVVQLLGKPDHYRAERPRTRSRPFGNCSPALRSWLMFYVGTFSPQLPTPSCQRTNPLSHGSALSQASFTIIITGLLTPASRLRNGPAITSPFFLRFRTVTRSQFARVLGELHRDLSYLMIGLLPISWSSDNGSYLFVNSVDEGSGGFSSIGTYLTQVAENSAGVLYLHFPRKPIGEQAPADEISPPHLRVRKLPQPGSVR